MFKVIFFTYTGKEIKYRKTLKGAMCCRPASAEWVEGYIFYNPYPGMMQSLWRRVKGEPWKNFWSFNKTRWTVARKTYKYS